MSAATAFPAEAAGSATNFAGPGSAANRGKAAKDSKHPARKAAADLVTTALRHPLLHPLSSPVWGAGFVMF